MCLIHRCAGRGVKLGSDISSMEKWLGWPQMGPGGSFFRLVQTLPTFWATWIWILRIFMFELFLDSKFPDFQVPRFPKSGPGAAWAGPSQA